MRLLRQDSPAACEARKRRPSRPGRIWGEPKTPKRRYWNWSSASRRRLRRPKWSRSQASVAVVQAGYAIADRVLRPALVGVSAGAPKAEAPAAGEPPAA